MSGDLGKAFKPKRNEGTRRVETMPDSMTLRDRRGRWEVRQVLEQCASPLALSQRTWDENRRNFDLASPCSSRKAVEDYRSPRRSAMDEAAGSWEVRQVLESEDGRILSCSQPLSLCVSSFLCGLKLADPQLSIN